MKLHLATAIVVLAIPVIEGAIIEGVFDIQDEIQDVYKVSPSFESVPESAFNSFFTRKLQTITDECTDASQSTLNADPVFNETSAANIFSCPTSRRGWVDENGAIVQVSDYRTCDQSELRAFCEANYALLELPDHKVQCEPSEEDERFVYLDAYLYDQVGCIAKDESCPSDFAAVTAEDIVNLYNLTSCTVEFLEEGHQPPQEPDDLEYDNLSQECVDELDIIFSDLEYRNASDSLEFGDCEPFDNYMSGNDSVVLVDYNACGVISDFTDLVDDSFEAQTQQITFTNFKMTCPGNLFYYFYSLWDLVGLSCPSDPADWTGRDFSAIVPGSQICVIEALEEGDEPPPKPSIEPPVVTIIPPATEAPVPLATEAPVPPATEAPDPPATEAPSAASELCLTWTIALLPAAATMLALLLMG